MARENEYIVKFVADTEDLDKGIETVEDYLDNLPEGEIPFAISLEEGALDELYADLNEVEDAEIGVSADTTKAVEDVENLALAIDNVEPPDLELGEMDTSQIEKATEAIEDLKEETGGTEKALGKLQEGFSSIKDVGEEALGPLDDLTGGLPSKFLDAFKGVKKFTSGMKLVKLAIASTGIGLLVIALGALATGFARNEEAMEKLKSAMAWMEGTFNVLKELFFEMGDVLFNAFSNPMEAIDSLKSGIEGLYEYFKTLIKVALTPAKIEFQLIKIALLEAARATKEFFGADATKLKEQIAEARGELQETIDTLKEDAQTLADPFVALAESVGEAMEEVGERIAEETEAINNLRKSVKQLARDEASSAVEREKIQGRINDLRSQMQDPELEFEERMALLEQLGDAEMAKAKNELDLAKRRLKNNEAEFRNGKKRNQEEYEDYQRLLEEKQRLENDLASVVRDNANERRDLLRDQKEKEQEEADERLEKLEEENEAYIEAQERQETLMRAMRGDAEQDEIDDLLAHYEELYEIADEFGMDTKELQERLGREIEEIKEKYRQEEIDAEKEKNDEIKSMEERRRDFVLESASSMIDTMGILNETFSKDEEESQKKAFKRDKNLQTAQAITATYGSANRAYQSQLIPGDPTSPIRATIAAGIAVANGLANVARIRKQKFDTGGSSGGRGGRGGGGSNREPQTPQLDLSFLQGDVQGSEALRAYVVENNVTSKQQANQQLTEQSTL